MLYDAEKLGRAPIMRPIEAPEVEAADDWRGEHLIRIPRQRPHGGGGYNMKSHGINGKQAARSARRERVQVLHAKGMTMTDIAATIGCSHSSVRADLIAMGLVEPCIAAETAVKKD